MTLGDRIVVINNGVVEQLGTPKDIYSKPNTKFVAEFIGSPQMNLFNCKIENGVATIDNKKIILIGILITIIKNLRKRLTPKIHT